MTPHPLLLAIFFLQIHDLRVKCKMVEVPEFNQDDLIEFLGKMARVIKHFLPTWGTEALLRDLCFFLDLFGSAQVVTEEEINMY